VRLRPNLSLRTSMIEDNFSVGCSFCLPLPSPVCPVVSESLSVTVVREAVCEVALLQPEVGEDCGV